LLSRLLVNSILPYVSLLRKYEVIGFGRHEWPTREWAFHHAFMVARPNSKLFAHWYIYPLFLVLFH
jgi:hypothetical protein